MRSFTICAVHVIERQIKDERGRTGCYRHGETRSAYKILLKILMGRELGWLIVD
jgi:hypothetical protein